jgi:hypothetical protein
VKRLLEEAGREGGVNRDGWYYLKDNWYRVEDHRVLVQQSTHWTPRAGLANEALAYLPLQEATYTWAGVPLVGGDLLTGEGGKRCTIRFEPGRLPPVNAFWSLTVYDDAGYLIPNPIDRYKLRSRDRLKHDPDGGLTLVLAASNPNGSDAEAASNWLPVPAAQFSVTFRAYWPKQVITHGGDGWHVPAVEAQVDH